MTTPRESHSNSNTPQAVVGFFRNGEDAHRALNELVDEGFSSRDIGAAFHSATGKAASATTERPGGTSRQLIDPDTTGVGSGASGPASGSTAVTPAGLSTGSGTATAGVGRPGPIPGSEIPHRSKGTSPGAESRTGSPVAARQGVTPTVAGDDYPPVSSSNVDVSREHNESSGWWDKLKHIFGSEESHDTNRTITEDANKTAQKFGTGEGHLNVSGSSPDSRYSGAAFEKSFSNFGISPNHSRYLARQLGAGGAVVTVRSGSRTAEAERILSRHGGSIRFEPATESSALEDWVDQDNDNRVEVFGEMRRLHRSPAASTTADRNAPSRRAS